MQNFPAKLLLIGEYSVLLGAPAIAFPLQQLCSAWSFEEGMAIDPEFIKSLERNDLLKSILSFQELKSDLQNGLKLNSAIPSSYGLGSSGVLCAALLKKYGPQKPLPLSLVREILVSMESFYHSKSSGLDPLISYYNCGIMVENDIELLHSTTVCQLKNYQLYLLDSKIPRSTAQYVNLFKEKLKNPSYHIRYEQNIVPLNKILVNQFLQNETNRFYSSWVELSQRSLEYYQEMIPPGVQDIWLKGIETKEYYVKLCGAGGGGYFLVLSNTSQKEMIKLEF
ncbi:MAG TPA: hypothetical protein PK006_03775 [Saprospiraceae bacterium]|nr:hypothetical protein [Saprospiraceae bacterium]